MVDNQGEVVTRYGYWKVAVDHLLFQVLSLLRNQGFLK